METQDYSHEYITRRTCEITRSIKGLQQELTNLLKANEELRRQAEELGGGFIE